MLNKAKHSLYLGADELTTKSFTETKLKGLNYPYTYFERLTLSPFSRKVHERLVKQAPSLWEELCYYKDFIEAKQIEGPYPKGFKTAFLDWTSLFEKEYKKLYDELFEELALDLNLELNKIIN